MLNIFDKDIHCSFDLLPDNNLTILKYEIYSNDNHLLPISKIHLLSKMEKMNLI